MKSLNVKLLLINLALTLFTSTASAVLITGDTTGSDNNGDASFWGIQFASGAGSISSVTFDLTADLNAFFDFNGDANFGGAAGPVIDGGSLIGLLASDISFTTSNFVEANPLHPALLTFNFVAAAFTTGDSFRFGTDTDFLVSDPAPGSVTGDGGTTMSVTLVGGSSGIGTFVRQSSTQSTVSVDISSVPEPGTLAIFALGLVGAGLSRRLSS